MCVLFITVNTDSSSYVVNGDHIVYINMKNSFRLAEEPLPVTVVLDNDEVINGTIDLMDLLDSAEQKKRNEDKEAQEEHEPDDEEIIL